MGLIRRKDEKDKDNEKKKSLEDRVYDKEYNALEVRLNELYSDAVKDMNGKVNKFLADYEVKNKQMKELLEQGKITLDEYNRWKQGQAFSYSVMQAQTDQLTQDLINTDKMAADIINGKIPKVYTDAYNLTVYKAELGAYYEGLSMIPNFTVYNTNAIAFLAKSPQLLPINVNLNIGKDFVWNKKHIATAISQGILQGESIPQIANRLMQVTNMDYNAAIRNARTATGAARNQGYYDATEIINEEGKKYGLEMVKTWSAVHDARTRDSHLFLDGTHPNKDGLFGVGYLQTPLRFPKDPHGAPQEVYNCRCTLLSQIKDIDHSKDRTNYEKWLKENYYDDWYKWKTSTKGQVQDLEREEAETRQQFIKAMWAYKRG